MPLFYQLTDQGATMRFTKIFTLLTAFLLLFSATLVIAQEDETCHVNYLFNAWARSAPEGMPNGAVFGQLVNIGTESDTLISATSDIAEAVELHEMMMGDGDMMLMQPVEDGFMVMPNNFVELTPGGFHIMLINLTQELIAGETFELTLNFENAGEVQVSVPIMEMMAMGEMGAMDNHSEHQDHSEEHSMMMGMAPSMEWDEACMGVHVLGSWARPAMMGMPNGAAYGLLLNLTEDDVNLVAASGDVAETIELHEMTMGDGDTMMMRPVEEGFIIPAGKATKLQPDGLHIMMIGLTGELAVDDEIELTLTFSNDDEQVLTVPVKEPKADGMKMGMDD
jgi:periplasmic copper chaperone A